MKKTLGERLKELRGNESQAQFCHKIQQKQGTYSAWERNEKDPASSAIALICSTNGVSADWLLGLTPYRHGTPTSNITATNSAINTNGSTRIQVTQVEERLLNIIESQQQVILNLTQNGHLLCR